MCRRKKNNYPTKNFRFFNSRLPEKSSTLREKEVGEFCTETKGPGQFSWLVLPIVTAL